MARQSSKRLKFKLLSIHIEYLSKSQAEWYTAKATRSTAQFVRKRRRRIASMMEETSGEAPDSAMKVAMEEAISSWYKANCKPRSKAAKIGTKARSGRDVFAHKEWKEVAKKKRELIEEAGFEGDQHIGFHQKAVTALWDPLPEEQKAVYRKEAVEWDNIAPPVEMQMINSESVSRRTWLFAEDIYRQANARMWAIITFRDKDGNLVKQIADHNDRLDGGTRLDVAFRTEYEGMQFEKLVERWMCPYYAGPPNPGPAQPPKKTRDLARVQLEKNSYGEPILPDVTQCPPNEDSHRKWITKVFRAFIFDSYSVASGATRHDISWTRLFSNLRRFVDDSFWPERLARDLKDPSVMRYDVLKAILGFWYQRQLAGADPVFSFSHYEDPKNDGIWLERVPRARVNDIISAPADAIPEKGGEKGKGKAKRDTPFPPAVGGSKPRVVPTPDWTESPLKRIGTTIPSVSPPRKRKKGRHVTTDEDVGSDEAATSRSGGETDSDVGEGESEMENEAKVGKVPKRGKGKARVDGTGSTTGASAGESDGEDGQGDDKRKAGRKKGKKAGSKGSSTKARERSKGKGRVKEGSDPSAEGKGKARVDGTGSTTGASAGESDGEDGQGDDKRKAERKKGKKAGSKGSSTKARERSKGKGRVEDSAGGPIKGKGKGPQMREDPDSSAAADSSAAEDSSGTRTETKQEVASGGSKLSNTGENAGERNTRRSSNGRSRSNTSRDGGNASDKESSKTEDRPPIPRKNMPTVAVGLTTRAKAKSSEIQTRSKTKSKGARPRAVAGGNTGDIFDLKDRRRKGKND
ncbi:hypothetical protein CC2G_013341 [Coprinopsis cinerea AmutBmut pab1-1]|nr:hypothetical protein CC2G_013341 [Coprinopsis cinerea AmutBmut pab1-1]